MYHDNSDLLQPTLSGASPIPLANSSGALALLTKE